ncbi:hypothetical protein ABZ770_16565 [Streptomyces sp. NPDC006654]|uniref:hypothetical protein n=1 Tax=Streptomyces sp. NPDC006654 TaxID=3156897 RepID=UPI0033FF9996
MAFNVLSFSLCRHPAGHAVSGRLLRHLPGIRRERRQVSSCAATSRENTWFDAVRDWSVHIAKAAGAIRLVNMRRLEAEHPVSQRLLRSR